MRPTTPPFPSKSFDRHFYAVQDERVSESAFDRAAALVLEAGAIREEGDLSPRMFPLVFQPSNNAVLVTPSTTEAVAEVVVPIRGRDVGPGVDRYPVAGLPLLFTLAEGVPDLGRRIYELGPAYRGNIGAALLALVPELDR